MKTINFKKVISTSIFMLFVGYTFAFSPEIKIAGSKKLELKLQNVTENTELIIRDLNGFAFFSETIEKSNNTFNKIFNLGNLPDGEYEIEIHGNVKVFSFPISISNDKIALIDEKSVFFKPNILKKNSKIYISKYNPNNEPLGITIYDNDGIVVYEETLSGKENLGRIIRISKPGNYNIQMLSDNKLYSHEVKID
jgi:hypothetical protein